MFGGPERYPWKKSPATLVSKPTSGDVEVLISTAACSRSTRWFRRDAAHAYAKLAVTAGAEGWGFPTADGYITAITVSCGFSVVSRDMALYEPARVKVINARTTSVKPQVWPKPDG